MKIAAAVDNVLLASFVSWPFMAANDRFATDVTDDTGNIATSSAISIVHDAQQLFGGRHGHLSLKFSSQYFEHKRV